MAWFGHSDGRQILQTPKLIVNSLKTLLHYHRIFQGHHICLLSVNFSFQTEMGLNLLDKLQGPTLIHQ